LQQQSQQKDVPFLLNVKQHDTVSILEQQTSSTSVEYIVTVGHLHFLGYFILQILHNQLRDNTPKQIIITSQPLSNKCFAANAKQALCYSLLLPLHDPTLSSASFRKLH